MLNQVVEESGALIILGKDSPRGGGDCRRRSTERQNHPGISQFGPEKLLVMSARILRMLEVLLRETALALRN